MPQVSRRVLKKDIDQKLKEIFRKALLEASDSKVIVPFVESVLTTTERKMLSKRMAVAYMLIKGHDYLAIGEVLKVSRQTVWSIKKDIESEKDYCKLLSVLLKEEKQKIFWEKLDTAISENFKPRYGTNWSTAGKRLIQRKKKLTFGF